MPPKNDTSRARVNPGRREDGASSAPAGRLGDHPAAGNRKRSVSGRGIADEGEKGDPDWLPSAAKKRKVSPCDATEVFDGAGEQNECNGADSATSDANPATGGDSSERAQKPKGGIDSSLPPISDVREMFEDMVSRLDPALLKESPFELNVATLCSGTDAPIFAMSLIQDAMQATGNGAGFEFKHVFSCEIEPFKQGFIRRNLPPGTPIFRDVVELACAKNEATTAGGSRVAIPDKKLDILFAGCSCVDYSTMNQNKPSGRVPSIDRHLKRKPKARKGRKENAAEEEEEDREGDDDDEDDGDVSPVRLDPKFVKDLEPGLEELLRLPAGESARTFFAALKLIADVRPKLVVLENVYGAPWAMYTNQIFPKICYVARAVKLDSKAYYLPQTRQRGYLVAVDAADIGAELATKIADEWQVQLSRCKRAPSASVSAFLRPADDPATILARADMESKSSTNAEWALCSLRHADARQKHGVRRDDNPFSRKAMRNGRLIFATYPSHSWRQFWDSQVARVVDLMDIAFAVASKQGIDLGYKTGMIDVSQNVDRNEFVLPKAGGIKNKLGVVGCITPCGMPIVTDLMRPVTGTETLSLQGLPVDELVISTESQAQLRDLAGNAMTVTVVGAVTLALLLAVSKVHPSLLDRIPSAQSRRHLYLEPPQPEQLEPGRASAAATAVAPLLAVAKMTARMCHCLKRTRDVLVCNVCGVTACSACGGNPKHDYSVDRTHLPELPAERGKIMLKNLVPDTLMLPVPPPVICQGLRAVENSFYCAVVSDILMRNPVYFFDEVKVAEAVTICYKAIDSIARLVLSPDSTCCWYLYIAPWHKDRARVSAAFDLDQPIARGLLSEDIVDAQWSVWTLGRIDLTLQLAIDEAGTVVVGDHLSFADDHVANRDAALLAWKKTVERKIRGAYLHHPDCGTAGNALRAKQGAAASSKVFMMWESGSLRDPALDHFVWTEVVRRIEPHEYRETLLHAHPTLGWKPEPGYTVVDVFWPGYWSSPPGPLDSFDLGKPEHAIRSPVQIFWGLAETIQLAPCHMGGEAPITRMPALAAISAPLGGFRVPPSLLSRIENRQAGASFYVVPATGCDAFLRLFAFISKAVGFSSVPSNLASLPHLRDEWVPVTPCMDCSVTPPDVTVYVKEDRKKGCKTENKFTKAMIENPEEAFRFERQYQDLPRAMAVAAKLRHGNAEVPVLDVRILLQPKTLASRALAYLLQAHRVVSRGRRAVLSDGKTSFKVTLDFAAPSAAAFAPFGASIRSCSAGFTAGIDDTNTQFSLPTSGPPRFSRESKRGRAKAQVRYELRPSQKDAVDWMLQRERIPLDFVKCEVEEEVIEPLSLRVVGKAEWQNRFPYSSRGGVVAHEIGYGKTVVSLALIDHMRAFDENESIAERREKVDKAWSQELPDPFDLFGKPEVIHADDLKPSAFFCHLAATLVIVPKHITDQWADEVEKFLGVRRPKLLVLKTTKAFYDQYTLDQLREAEIIIVSTAVFTDAFMNRLQTVAGRGSDYPKGLSGRTLEAWYRGALRNHRALTAYYLAGRVAGRAHNALMRTLWEELLPGLVKKQQSEIDKLMEKQVPEIDRTLYKQAAKQPMPDKPAAAAAAGTSTTGSEETGDGDKQNDGAQADVGVEEEEVEEAAGSKLGPSEWNISWLHTCSFSRIIWDECSYDDEGCIRLFVANAVANAKWLISGTPKLFGLEQVCRMAEAFGIHVARPEPRMMPGLPAVTKGPELSPMSKSEEFHCFSSRVRSIALAHERHSRAQMFVEAFFRSNTLDADMMAVGCEEHVRTVAMTAPDSARYHLLSQELLDAGYDYTALPAHARSQVVLRGSDLAGRDGHAAARMLLGLLACGLGDDGGSLDSLMRDLSSRSDALNDQMKLLWDKTLWLWRWIRELEPKDDPRFKFSLPVQDTLARVELLCDTLTNALLDGGGFEDFGGKDMFQREAAVIAGLRELKEARNLDPDLGSLRTMFGSHFGDGWAEYYHRDKALYTWLDFFRVEEPSLQRLTEGQLRLLAQDICWLKCKVAPHGTLFVGRRLNTPFLQQALDAASTAASRSIPQDIDGLAASDMGTLDGLTERELRQFVRDCASTKRGPQTWHNARSSFVFNVPAGKGVKAGLQERLTELNLKFSSGHSISDLKEILWRHENGLAACDNYRDGRAPPSRHRDLELATWCGGTVAKQMETTHEELKRTMVHLFKTIEDLRATRLEANFVPEYFSLATAEDKDDVVRKKRCGGCRALLESAATSFLVVACGHFLCGGCRSAAGFYCPVKDCPAFIRKRPVLRCSQVPRPSSIESGLRAKADSVAEMIKNEIPGEDYVVVFAQYRPLIEALDRAFREADLRCLNLAAMGDEVIARKLEDFKGGDAGQILLLDMDSETSAGSNLTIATHVVFVNPYVHQDEEHQRRTVRQAKGRCIRTGQSRTVQVYHFMVPGTIEEETLRKYASDSPSVKQFFEQSDRIPWWLDEEEGV